MKKLIALGVLAAVVAALKVVPWWAGVGLVVALGASAKFLIGRVFRNAALGLFETKSAVLRGASARLHAITEAPEPKPDFGDDFDFEGDDDGDALEALPRVWRYVDVTVEVPEHDGSSDCAMAMTMWEPDELMIVDPSARSGKAKDLEGFDDEVGDVHQVHVMQGGNWVPLEGDKVVGSQRLRLHVGVKPGVDGFKLRYYFEVLRNRN